MDFLKKGIHCIKPINPIQSVTALLTQYGLDSVALSQDERTKLKSLKGDAFNALIASFQILRRTDSYLMEAKGQGETNARWLIHTLNDDNAQEFFRVLEILINSKLIARQMIVDFNFIPRRPFSRLTTKLADCTKEEIKAFLQLVLAMALKNSDTGKDCITEEHFEALLNTSQDKGVLPELLKLVILLRKINRNYFLAAEYKQLMVLNNVKEIQNLQKSITLLAEHKIRVNTLNGQNIFEMLLKNSGKKGNLVALQTRVIQALATNEKLFTEDNVYALLNSLVMSYDVSAEQIDALFLTMEKTAPRPLTQDDLDRILHVLNPNVSCQSNPNLEKGNVSNFEVKVLKEIDLQNREEQEKRIFKKWFI